MAGGQERILRRRIRSVQATKKITRAMELIAGSRIVRAQQRVHAAMPYSDQITAVVKDLAAAGGEVRSPLLNGREKVSKVCFVALTADRGLCGGYNTGVIRATEGEVKKFASQGLDYSLVLVGKKADGYFRFRGYRIDANYTGFTDNPTYEDAKRVASKVREMFEAGEVDKVELVYTRFASAGSQEVVQRPLIPLGHDVVEGGDGKPNAPGGTAGASSKADFEFEPSPAVILEELLPRYLEARVYAAMLNAAASEHAFRQRAMKAATDNAEELIRNLSRIMNRARQDSITTEIMEIVSGAEALGSGSGDTAADRALTRLMAFEAITNGASTMSATTMGIVTRPVAAVDITAIDDLEGDIEGIGPVIAGKLSAMGITTFRQVASWTQEDIDRIGAQLDFKGRIEREQWVEQAKRFHFEKYGEQL